MAKRPQPRNHSLQVTDSELDLLNDDANATLGNSPPEMPCPKDQLEKLKSLTKKLKTELATEKGVFFSIAELANDGFFDWDMITGYEYMSPRFWEIFGYKPSEKQHLASEWQSIVHPEDLAETLNTVNAHVVDRSVPLEGELRYRHKDGSVVWVYFRAKIIAEDENGKPTRMAGTHTDITHIRDPHERADW